MKKKSNFVWKEGIITAIIGVILGVVISIY